MTGKPSLLETGLLVMNEAAANRKEELALNSEMIFLILVGSRCSSTRTVLSINVDSCCN